MAIITDGTNAGVAAAVDPTAKAMRVSLRPPEISGSYGIAINASTAAGPLAGANLVSLRWGDPGTLLLLRRISLCMLVTTASTAGLPEMAAYVARGFTSPDTGGTHVVMSGDQAKKRTSYPSSRIGSNGDLRFGSGVALTAGVRTLDVRPILAVSAPLAASTNQYLIVLDLLEDPIVLTESEGIVVQNVNALTGGAYRFVVDLEWQEIAAASY